MTDRLSLRSLQILLLIELYFYPSRSLDNVPGSPQIPIVEGGEGTVTKLGRQLFNYTGDRDAKRDSSE